MKFLVVKGKQASNVNRLLMTHLPGDFEMVKMSIVGFILEDFTSEPFSEIYYTTQYGQTSRCGRSKR